MNTLVLGIMIVLAVGSTLTVSIINQREGRGDKKLVFFYGGLVIPCIVGILVGMYANGIAGMFAGIWSGMMTGSWFGEEATTRFIGPFGEYSFGTPANSTAGFAGGVCGWIAYISMGVTARWIASNVTLSKLCFSLFLLTLSFCLLSFAFAKAYAVLTKRHCGVV